MPADGIWLPEGHHEKLLRKCKNFERKANQCVPGYESCIEDLSACYDNLEVCQRSKASMFHKGDLIVSGGVGAGAASFLFFAISLLKN